MMEIRMPAPLKRVFASAMLAFSLFSASPLCAADLSRDEAESVLWDTFTIASYTGLNGESDYAGEPGNIICAALFGAFNARMEFDFRQEYMEQNGGSASSEDAPLFTVNGRPLMPDGVHTRENYPSFFRGVPEQYTAFVSREAAELAALHFTGRILKEHRQPAAGGILGETQLTPKGYFIGVDGLGDIPIDLVVRKYAREGEAWIIAGDLIDMNADDGDAPSTFLLRLTPGEAPGTWKRQYMEKPAR